MWAGNLKGEWVGGKNTPPRSYVGWVGKRVPELCVGATATCVADRCYFFSLLHTMTNQMKAAPTAIT